MFKSWSRVFVLVLALSSFSRGQDNDTTVSPYTDDEDPSTDPAADDAKLTTPSLPSNTSGNGTEGIQFEDDVIYDGDPIGSENSTNEGNSSASSETSTPVSRTTTKDKTTLLPTTELSTPSPPVTKAAPTGGSSWAYVILVLIFLVIIVLCIILYLLRRASRTYTFDLQRPVPTNNLNEPIGTFEQVYLDDHEQPAPKNEVITDDISSTANTNGTALQLEGRNSNGDSTPQEQPDSNGVETSPTSNTSPSPGDEQTDNHSANSTNLFFDAIGEEQQNENNNNPSVHFSDPFVEINLEDPALSNQLLTSPEASSSVLPFSPFSFSSSSS